ncbi:MAG: SH3 domain-containing protein [Bacteroidales bacterium]|nr:SH3 domain-containing protein [Bacteroidales bacterium]
MKKLIFLLVIIILMISCGEKKQKTTDESTNEAVCIWNGASLREGPSNNSKWLSSVSLGEKVTLLEEIQTDTIEDIEYSKVQLSDGKEGWISSNLIIQNGKLAALKYESTIYKRPDLLTVTDKAFDPMEMVVIISDSLDWLEVIGNQKKKSGWIKNTYITEYPDDVTIAILATIALEEKDYAAKNKKLKEIVNNSEFYNSWFYSTVKDLIDPFEVNKVIQVKTAKEFINSIASDVKIELTANKINLSVLGDSAIGMWDGYELIISDIKNLIIEGTTEKYALILTDNDYADVLTFENSNNIALKNISIGHTGETGGCEESSVIALNNCHDIFIKECDIYGSGDIGLKLNGVITLRFNNSVIRECSSSIIECHGSDKLFFEANEFKNNRSYNYAFYFDESNGEFRNCDIQGNGTYNASPELFYIDENFYVFLFKSSIKANLFYALQYGKGELEIQDCLIEENLWDSEEGEGEDLYYDEGGDYYEEGEYYD